MKFWAKFWAELNVLKIFIFFLSRYFLLRLSRFLALFNIDNEKIINDETFKDVSDDDNEIIKTLRD